jgi:HlyD family secretion protein
MKKLWLLLVVPALLLLWWAAERKDAIPNVHFARVARQTIASTIPTNGKVEPVKFAAARAEIAGVVQSISVDKGQDVKAGQTLVVLDNAAQRAAVNSSEALVQQARADQSVIEQGGRASELADIQSSLATARLQLKEAQRNLDSLQRLYSKQAATQQEVMNAQDAVQRATLQIQSLERRQKSLVSSADRSVTEAKLHDAEAGLALSRHQFALTTIRSPMSGTVYQFDLKLGAYLNLGDLVAMIGDLNQVRVRVYVDEPDLGRVAEGLPVDIMWEAKPGQKWSGHVTQVPTEIVALGTRQVGVVTCIIDNPGHQLLPGTNVDANIISKVVENAISVPKQAVQTTSQGSGVFKLVENNKVKWTPVTSGVSNLTSIEIRSGLKAGDRVALPSDVTLSDGMAVKPVLE